MVNKIVSMHGEIVAGGAEGGMSLRDYFAANVIPALVADSLRHGRFVADEIAPDAYVIADAMLKARTTP